MTKTAAFLVCLALILTASPVLAQQESNPAAERARIADQRIQAEADRQARLKQQAAEAEARLQAEAEAARAREAQDRVAAAAPPPAPTRPPADRPLLPMPEEQARMDKALEQIRSLGELRDAGYVTDEEFELIKRRILDDRL